MYLCFYQLRKLRVVPPSLTKDASKSMVQAFVHCRLDYCNSLLSRTADAQTKQLQSVHCGILRLVWCLWLDVLTVLRQFNGYFQAAVFVLKCIRGVTLAWSKGALHSHWKMFRFFMPSSFTASRSSHDTSSPEAYCILKAKPSHLNILFYSLI